MSGWYGSNLKLDTILERQAARVPRGPFDVIFAPEVPIVEGPDAAALAIVIATWPGSSESWRP
jgi:hypothetical protein